MHSRFAISLPTTEAPSLWSAFSPLFRPSTKKWTSASQPKQSAPCHAHTQAETINSSLSVHPEMIQNVWKTFFWRKTKSTEVSWLYGHAAQTTLGSVERSWKQTWWCCLFFSPRQRALGWSRCRPCQPASPSSSTTLVAWQVPSTTLHTGASVLSRQTSLRIGKGPSRPWKCKTVNSGFQRRVSCGRLTRRPILGKTSAAKCWTKSCSWNEDPFGMFALIFRNLGLLRNQRGRVVVVVVARGWGQPCCWLCSPWWELLCITTKAFLETLTGTNTT